MSDEIKAHVHQFSMHLVNEETSQAEERTVTAKLPIWLWDVIEARARYHHKGNLDEGFSELLYLGIEKLKEDTILSEDIPPNPSKWS